MVGLELSTDEGSMGTLIEDITKMSPTHLENVALALIAVVAPGYLMVIHFWPQLFLELDNVKLFFLAISLSLPVSAFNTLALRASMKFSMELKDSYHSAMIVSFIYLYGLLLLAWARHLPFNVFVSVVCGVEVVFFLFCFRARKQILMDRIESLKRQLAEHEQEAR
jgi:hypothetical protein